MLYVWCLAFCLVAARACAWYTLSSWDSAETQDGDSFNAYNTISK